MILDTEQSFLTNEGCNVSTCKDGTEALARVSSEAFDLIILDLNLPDIDGYEVCKRIRQDPRLGDIPIIMFTGDYTAVEDKIRGIEEGADDYITKPFSPRELVARVRAVLRRVRGGVRQPGLTRSGEMEIDLHGHSVTLAGESIHLTRTEFNLLATLAQHPGQTFTRAQLLDRLHGVAWDGFDRSVDAHIKNLRRKLEPDPVEPCYVLTVYGIGYKFTDEV